MLIILSRFQRKYYNVSLILHLQEINHVIELLANGQSSGKVWVYWVVELENEGELKFGLRKFFPKIIHLYAGC